MFVFQYMVVVCQYGRTALMMATTRGSIEIVRLLLNAGATVNNKDITVSQCVYFLSKFS